MTHRALKTIIFMDKDIGVVLEGYYKAICEDKQKTFELAGLACKASRRRC